MIGNYIIPGQSRIGHVHLKVADLNRSVQFETWDVQTTEKFKHQN